MKRGKERGTTEVREAEKIRKQLQKLPVSLFQPIRETSGSGVR